MRMLAGRTIVASALLTAQTDSLAAVRERALVLSRLFKFEFIYPVGKQLSVAARAFMDFARAEAGSLVRDALGQPQR